MGSRTDEIQALVEEAIAIRDSDARRYGELCNLLLAKLYPLAEGKARQKIKAGKISGYEELDYVSLALEYAWKALAKYIPGEALFMSFISQSWETWTIRELWRKRDKAKSGVDIVKIEGNVRPRPVGPSEVISLDPDWTTEWGLGLDDVLLVFDELRKKLMINWTRKGVYDERVRTLGRRCKARDVCYRRKLVFAEGARGELSPLAIAVLNSMTAGAGVFERRTMWKGKSAF